MPSKLSLTPALRNPSVWSTSENQIIRTPWEGEIESIFDHCVVDEASVPRIDGPVRSSGQITLHVFPSNMVGTSRRPHIGCAIAFLTFSQQVPLGHRRTAFGEIHFICASRCSRVDQLKVREISVLRIRQVEIVSAQVFSEAAFKRWSINLKRGPVSIRTVVQTIQRLQDRIQ